MVGLTTICFQMTNSGKFSVQPIWTKKRRIDSIPAENKCEKNDNALQSLLSEVDCFILVNHLYWGLWAVNQASAEGCDDFDYLLYAANRIGQYRALRGY